MELHIHIESKITPDSFQTTVKYNTNLLVILVDLNIHFSLHESGVWKNLPAVNSGVYELYRRITADWAVISLQLWYVITNGYWQKSQLLTLAIVQGCKKHYATLQYIEFWVTSSHQHEGLRLWSMWYMIIQE